MHKIFLQLAKSQELVVQALKLASNKAKLDFDDHFSSNVNLICVRNSVGQFLLQSYLFDLD